MAEEVALLILRDIGANKIVTQLRDKFKDLTITRSTVTALKRHPSYHAVMERDAEAKVKSGKIELRAGVAGQVEFYLAALRKMITKGNAQALALAFKVMGVDIVENAGKQENSLTIVMPGAKSPERVIDVKDEKKD